MKSEPITAEAVRAAQVEAAMPTLRRAAELGVEAFLQAHAALPADQREAIAGDAELDELADQANGADPACACWLVWWSGASQPTERTLLVPLTAREFRSRFAAHLRYELRLQRASEAT